MLVRLAHIAKIIIMKNTKEKPDLEDPTYELYLVLCL